MGEESNTSDGTSLTEDEYSRIKVVNTIGMGLCIAGGIAAYTFWFVPTSKRRIRERLRNEHKGMADATSNSRLNFSFTGNGFLLNGTF